VQFWAASDDNGDGAPLPQAQQLLGTTAEYDNSDFCASPARDYEFDRPKYLHHVILAGLKPGGRYIYRVSCNLHIVAQVTPRGRGQGRGRGAYSMQ